jgi:hypothetical protein
VSLPEICDNTSAKLNKQQYDEGYRINASTLGFINRETRHIRITNLYTFGMIEIIAVWNNKVSIMQLPTDTGITKIKMYPKLSGIWITVNGNPIISKIPADVLDKMKHEINNLVGGRYVVVEQINLDQFEMLYEHKIFKLPDLIFEKLLIYARFHTIASSEIIHFNRKIPDDIKVIVTLEHKFEYKIEYNF